MKTTSVALGPHFEDFIQASIQSGRYNNASEVLLRPSSPGAAGAANGSAPLRRAGRIEQWDCRGF